MPSINPITKPITNSIINIFRGRSRNQTYLIVFAEQHLDHSAIRPYFFISLFF